MSQKIKEDYINGKQIGKSVTVNSKGTYSIGISKQKAGTEIVVKMSKSGYSTIQKTIKVLNEFSTFMVNSVKKSSTTISGKGLKGATVKDYINGIMKLHQMMILILYIF